MFPSLGILHHYVEFNTCTITTLEKLLGVGSFDGFINHLVCGQAIFLVSSTRSTSLLWFELLPSHSWGVGH